MKVNYNYIFKSFLFSILMITGLQVHAQYCLPTYNSQCTSNDFIESVSFNSINNLNTGCPNPGPSNYSDYTNMITTINQSLTYSLSVTASPNFGQYFVAFIDFNQDLDFDDADEFFDIGYANAGETLDGSITVPLGAALDTTRLRVMCRYFTAPLTQADVCAIGLSFGEVEDYSLFIAPAPTCPPPTAVTITNVLSNTADVSWTSGGTTASSNIEYGPAGFMLGTGTFVSNATSPYTMMGLTPNTDYDVYVQDSCTDMTLSPWGQPGNFLTPCDIFTAPYTEDFEDGGQIDQCWTAYSSTGEFWQYGDFSSAFYGPDFDNTTGTGFYAWVDDSEGPSSPDVTIESPLVDISGLTTPQLAFFVFSENSGTGPDVVLTIEVWDGVVWDSMASVSGNTGGWLEVGIDLSGLTPTGPVKARFILNEQNGSFQNDLAIDDVMFREAPPCPNPSFLSVLNITDVTAEVSWVTGGNSISTNIEYGPPGFTPGTGTVVSASTNPFTITGLAANTSYDFYVQEDCDNGDLSDFIGPQTFTTSCAVFTAPYTEDFEDGGLIDNCWTTFSSTGEFWLFGTGSAAFYGPDFDNTTGTGYYAWVDDSEGPSSPDVTLESPLVDVSSLTNPEVAFFVFSENSGTGAPTTDVILSVDIWDGAAWNVAVASFSGNSNGWAELSVPLGGFTITGPVRARFVLNEQNGAFQNDLALDDVMFREAPTCPNPGFLSAGVTTDSSVELSWLASGAGQYINVEYGPVGFTAGTGTTVQATTNPFILTGLTPDTDYWVYIQDVCSNTDSSFVIGPVPFVTECGTFLAPYAEDFEDGGILDNCWSESSSTGEFWQYGTGNAAFYGPDGDHTTGTGYYAWVDDSEGPSSPDVTLESPQIDISTLNAGRLAFWFYSENGGTNAADTVGLTVEVFDGTTWTPEFYFSGSTFDLSGNPGWQEFFVPLTNYTGVIKLRFIANEANGAFQRDVALDDILVSETPINDIGVTTISGLNASCSLGNSTPITVSLFNFGANVQTFVKTFYSINGATPVQEFYTGTLNPGITEIYTFQQTADFSAPGTYEIKAWMEFLTIPGPDDNILNDTATTFVTSIPVISNYPYAFGFENGDGGWTSEGTNNSWAVGMPTGTVINSAASGQFAAVTNPAGQYNNSEVSFFTSPCLDFSSLVDDPILRFSINFLTEACCDEGWVETSIDGGVTWVKLGTSGTGINWYNDALNQWWDGDAGFTDWVNAEQTLVGFAGESSVRIRFAFASDGSVLNEGFGLDDIVILETPTHNLGVSDVAGPNPNCTLGQEVITIDITNYGLTDEFNFPVFYSVDGGVPVMEMYTDTLFIGMTDTYVFTATADFSNDGNYDVISWTGLATDQYYPDDSLAGVFVNIPNLSSFPYNENFETNTGGWTTEGISSTWAFGAPNGTIINSAANGVNAWVTNLSGNYNNSENSSLVSPCLDLSALVDDPQLEFSIHFNSEACCDEGWVEYSIDGGATYTKLGTSASGGTNWYNDGVSNWWNGDGGFTGWVTASHPLTGLAGEGDVRIRFMFSSDGSIQAEGFGVDDVSIVPFCSGFTVGTSSVEQVSGAGLGSATAIPSGGIAPYNYQWDDAAMQTTATANNLPAGTYNVTIIDAGGCPEFVSVTVMLSCPPFNMTSVVTIETSNGAADGAINLTVNAGQDPYTFVWSNMEVTEDISNLSGGNFTVTVTDANGCSEEQTFTVPTCPADFGTTSVITDESNPSAQNGSIDLTVNGGVGPYTYLWSTGFIGEDPSGLSGTNYIVTITDAVGCQDIVDFTVGTLVNTSEIDGLSKLSIFPNPAQSFATIQLEFDRVVDVQVEVLNTIGQVLSSDVSMSTTAYNADLDLSQQSSGIYFIRITAENESITKRLIIAK